MRKASTAGNNKQKQSGNSTVNLASKKNVSKPYKRKSEKVDEEVSYLCLLYKFLIYSLCIQLFNHSVLCIR